MLLHLAWRRNLDRLDLALAANRIAALGAPLWWLGAAGPTHEPGDYLCDVDAAIAARIAAFGIVATVWRGGLPDGAVAIAYPRIALLTEPASADPHLAFYAMALARLGFHFELVDGRALADNILARFDLLVLPSGTSAWGLDAADGIVGADAAVREFLAGHGAALGSGGGALYLASGRSGWAGIAPVQPIYTHEYLRTGVGIVSLLLDADSIGFGCPPTIDTPYFHGPVFAELDGAVSAAARFQRLVMPGDLFAANPLDDEIFARDLAGNAAILRTETLRGRAVLFSASPEMGDLARKYIALGSYVPRYLQVAGEGAMSDLLRHYRPLEPPSWRLILNAIHSLMLRRSPGAGAPPAAPALPPGPGPQLVDAVGKVLASPKFAAEPPLAAVVEALGDDLRKRLSALRPRLAALEADRRSSAICSPAGEAAAIKALEAANGAPAAERLAAIETALTLAEAGCLFAEAERHFGGAYGGDERR